MGADQGGGQQLPRGLHTHKRHHMVAELSLLVLRVAPVGCVRFFLGIQGKMPKEKRTHQRAVSHPRPGSDGALGTACPAVPPADVRRPR